MDTLASALGMRTGQPRPQALAGVPATVELLTPDSDRLGPTGSMGSRVAFVLEGDASVRNIETTLLEISGFHVEAFDNETAALGRMHAASPDIVLMEPFGTSGDRFAVMRR